MLTPSVLPIPPKFPMFKYKKDGSVDKMLTAFYWYDNPGLTGIMKETPIHLLSGSSFRSFITLQAVIEHNACYGLVSQPDSSGMTPLHLACFNGDYEAWQIINYFLSFASRSKEIVRVNSLDSKGRSALHYAIETAIRNNSAGISPERNYALNIINELILAGANFNIPTILPSGVFITPPLYILLSNPLFADIVKSNSAILATFPTLRVIQSEALESQAASSGVMAVTDNLVTLPVNKAFQYHGDEKVDEMATALVWRNTPFTFGPDLKSSMHYLVLGEYRSFDAMRIIMNNSFELINVRNQSGLTPLYYACIAGDQESWQIADYFFISKKK